MLWLKDSSFSGPLLISKSFSSMHVCSEAFSLTSLILPCEEADEIFAFLELSEVGFVYFE